MSDTYYFDRLYPFQDEALAAIKATEHGFYLTGGTAASRGYLRHRFSDDLDLFVNDHPSFSLWADRIVHAAAENETWKTEVALREKRYVRVFLNRPEISLKIEMVNDVASHLGDLREDPVLGRLDSPENILANKISALVDRGEPKDLADIWGFCCRLDLSITAALEGAKSKAAGLFPADVARLLLSAIEDDWQVIRWTEPPPQAEFLQNLRQLGEELLLIR